jgi:xanthine dehydrogenase accessory factor
VKPAEVALSRLAHEPGVWVTVEATQGSVPREAGTWMAVFRTDCVGTIGGGHVEFQAIAQARACLGGQATGLQRRFALGPSLGQCCGGVMQLRFQPVDAASVLMLRQRLAAALTPLALFGGGHVGQALVLVLARLPFSVCWIDSRDGVFPDPLPDDVVVEQSDPVQAAVAYLAPHSHVLIMSFSHAEDLDIVAACLDRIRTRDDLPYVGLIGSRTKWATFRHRLLARGFTDAELAHITSPIGIAGVPGKEPEVIAIAVAAQLLQLRHLTGDAPAP